MSRKKKLDHMGLLKALRHERRKVDQLQEIIRKLHRRIEGKGGAKPRQPSTRPTVGTTPKPPTNSKQ